MTRVTPTKAARNSGAGIVRSVEKSNVRGARRAEKTASLRGVTQGAKAGKKTTSKRRSGMSASSSKAKAKLTPALTPAAGDMCDDASDVSRDSRQSSGSEGLDCLCDAVRLELSNGGHDDMEHDDLDENHATTPRKDIADVTREARTGQEGTTGSGDVTFRRPQTQLPAATSTAATGRDAHVAESLDLHLCQSLSLQTTSTPTMTTPAQVPAVARTNSARAPSSSGAGSAFEVVAPRTQADGKATAARALSMPPASSGKATATARATTAAVSPASGDTLTSKQRQELILQVQREQCMITALEQKYGKVFPEVGRRNLGLARLLSSLGELRMAHYCLRRSWDAFRTNFCVSRSPLSCIQAYKALFESIRGSVDAEVLKQMHSMETAVEAARRATTSAGVGGAVQRAVAAQTKRGSGALTTQQHVQVAQTVVAM